MATESPILRLGLLRNLYQFGIEPRLRDVLAVAGGVCATIAAAAIFFGPVAGLGLGAVLLLTGPAVLNILAARRVAELGVMMPSFFDRVRQLLAVGNSLSIAFERAARGSPPKLATFLRAHHPARQQWR